MSNSQIMIVVPLLLILGAATLIDWREHKIPNVLTFGAGLFGLILQGSLNGAPGVVFAAAGWAVCLVSFLPLYVRGGMSAGDVKLMAAVGAFMGPVAGIFACLFTLIAGGLIGLASIACVWSARHSASSSAETGIDVRDALRSRIPYAGAIAAGTSFVLLVPDAIPASLSQFGG